MFFYFQYFIVGQVSEVFGGQCMNLVNFINEEVYVSVVQGMVEDVVWVVVVVCVQLDGGVWSWFLGLQCGVLLYVLVVLVECDVDLLVDMDVNVIGCLFMELCMMDVFNVVSYLCVVVGWVNQMEGCIIFMVGYMGKFMLFYIICELIGVVGVILFWNVLFMIISWKVVVLLVVGCMVVIKLVEEIL